MRRRSYSEGAPQVGRYRIQGFPSLSMALHGVEPRLRKNCDDVEACILCGHGFPRGLPSKILNAPRFLALISVVIFTLALFSSCISPASAAPSGAGSPAFVWPLQGRIIMPFRPATGPYGSGGHAGIDIDAIVGTPVKASSEGTITFAGNTPLGICVSIAHAGGIKTTYVSLSEASVKKGMRVSKGSIIGKSDGCKDKSTSLPHLHFGAYLNDIPIDPLLLLNGSLLDPSRNLFLGPWEDVRSAEKFLEAQSSGNPFKFILRGLASLGNKVSGLLQRGWELLCKALAKSWSLLMSAIRAAGGAMRYFYKSVVAPLASKTWSCIYSVLHFIFSNKFVQALLAAVAAIAIIVCLVLAIALAFGISLATAVVAIILGSIAAIGYALYYAFSCGDSFNFAQCFLGCLVVGGSVAVATLCFAQFYPLLVSGWSKLGFIGFAKTFLVHGMADSLAYVLINKVTGKPISWSILLLSFFLGGLMGGTGKLFIAGISERILEGLAIGSAVAGSGMEGISLASTSLGIIGKEGLLTYLKFQLTALTTALVEKLAYITFCGCTGFLLDFSIHLITGARFTFNEALISFFGGALVGGLSVALFSTSPIKVLKEYLGIGKSFFREFAKSLAKKLINRGGKELINPLARGGDQEGGGIQLLP